MSFRTPCILRVLIGRRIDGRQLYLVERDLVFASQQLERDILIPEGAVTDLASVPRAPLAWWIAGGRGTAAAVVHDWLCQRRAEVCPTSDRAADVFDEALMDEDEPAWVRAAMVTAVRLFGPRW